MNPKLEQVVNFLQSKSASLTVAEINSICQILNSLKEVPKKEKLPEEKK